MKDGIPRPVEVSLLDESRSADWDHFIGSQPNGSFYQLSGWQRINAAEFGHKTYLVCGIQTGEMVAALPLTLIEGPVFGRILCSVPFLNYGGPCAADPGLIGPLVGRAQELARELRVKYMELRCIEQLPIALPASTQKVSVTLDLTADPQTLFDTFDGKHRREIRRAQKNGLEIVAGGKELLAAFYALLEQSWGELGTPLYRRTYFERVLGEFPDHTRIFVCSKDGVPVGAAFNGYFNGTVEGMWAAAGPRARELMVNYALYWEMMRDACERGCKVYHLGRSTADSGGEQFKKKWNARVRQLYWHFYRPDGGAMPELNVNNPKYRVAIATWQKLPLWVTRGLGPWLAQQIP